MCVAIPTEIAEITPGALPMARLVGRDGECCLAYYPEAKPGDFVLTQHGFAIQLLTAEEAEEVLAAFSGEDYSKST
ncbi:MAG: HypC/HybG/HupF family hydrogenase formation chaperone [Propionibacteriaceae bacterium]|jgi:hydrogenase expression/formation protein HypC|nr:HypC/HybG/HupF family hydrogenase formation chaperone [Propionibacteriaceae bacterium]